MLDENHIHIGLRIRRARQAAGLTQEQLGDKIGVGQSVIARMEMSPWPHNQTIMRVALALGVPFEQLKPPPEPPPPKEPSKAEQRRELARIAREANSPNGPMWPFGIFEMPSDYGQGKGPRPKQKENP
jgi:transcriptional regulator with XRE-family HTH domain